MTPTETTELARRAFAMLTSQKQEIQATILQIDQEIRRLQEWRADMANQMATVQVQLNITGRIDFAGELLSHHQKNLAAIEKASKLAEQRAAEAVRREGVALATRKQASAKNGKKQATSIAFDENDL